MTLEARSVRKAFGGVVALDDVSVALPPAQVTCILGDNGAGKSTLIRILAGVLAPDSGEIRLDGHVISFDSPRAALDAGVATLHQDLALVPMLAAWRNFFLGREPVVGRGPFRRIDVEHAKRVTLEEVRRFGVELTDPDRPVGTLSGGERQSLAIARALHAGARVLILDEPTAALGVKQAALVLEAIRRTRQQGTAVVLITHNPAHALEVGDAFVILRQGRALARYVRADATIERLAVRMGGAEL
jgi:simple sugar transport system ATP-binding protein